MKRKHIRQELKARAGNQPIRIGVLGGSTTNAVVDMLELLLLADGYAPEFYQSEYGRYYEEATMDAEKLIAFRPDIVYIHTSCVNVPEIAVGADEDAVANFVLLQLSRFQAIWDSLSEKLSCQVIQNNFELPPFAVLGNMDATAVAGRTRVLARLNEAFAEEAGRRPQLLIQDVHRLSAELGLKSWFDWDRYFSYKLLLTSEANFELARSLSAMVRAIYGRSRKVLVLDLDNTLWGGVIGDDGVDKIQIGLETPIAEAHTAFQKYCLSLRERGILLAVCSKNNEEVAREGFLHPSSVLKLEDFSSFKANWLPKHENLLAIAKELNLGVDSLVFVDDNPAEREIVRANLPEVAVPEVGSEVTRYAQIVDAGHYFEPVSLSKEDLKRAALYTENAQRAANEARFTDYGEYLDSLDMVAEIAPFKPVYIERIAQLTNKTNQFNLTTRRYTLAEMEALAESPGHVSLYGRLVDKFGDNGLISVVAGSVRGEVLNIDLWLMSCRVLKRDMELAMLDALVARVRPRGVKWLRGTYLPTKKNGMVAAHYPQLGFEPVADDALAEGATAWTLDVTSYVDKNSHIRVSSAVESALVAQG